ncbi:MAG: hypothetical protein U1E19_03310 [Rhodoblastus sp.]
MVRETAFAPSRRCLLKTIGALAVSSPARAQAPSAVAPQPYRVPGGRIGFDRPRDVAPLNNSWRLLSPDQTFSIQVIELEFSRTSPFWVGDPRRERVATPAMAGFEIRRWRDTRYRDSLDYSEESVSITDGSWLGYLTVSTSTLGNPVNSVPGGQIRRWRKAMDLALDSVSVRGLPPASSALAELQIQIGVAQFEPRLVGESLLLEPPQKPYWSARNTVGPHVSVANLGQLPFSDPELIHRMYADFLKVGRRLEGGASRGVLMPEQRIIEDDFATRLHAFGRRRHLEMTAFYTGATRSSVLAALHEAFRSLKFLDEPARGGQ